jgi:thiamine biosynthesis lipoprotein
MSPHEALFITTDRITLKHGLVDVGGFGKGYALDAVVHLLKEKHHLVYFLVNGGGDMYGTSNHKEPIEIYLEHPTVAATYLSTTTLLNQGFAASSPHKRTWQHAGITYSHIIDTTSGVIVSRPDATFIKATTACTADIFATVALIVTLKTMQELSVREQLGVASFSLIDNTFTHNPAFTDNVRT